jgi:XTP/dITP diphosphohydrolase
MNNSFQLLIATRNPGKMREFASLLDAAFPNSPDYAVRLRSLAEFPTVGEAPEPHFTFEENALAKARFYCAHTKAITLADDSGLEVDALGGAPGVHSARYGGAHLTDMERTELLLDELARSGNASARARFRCAIAIVVHGHDETYKLKGICEGRISRTPRGVNGFGYDPVFIPDGFTQTFAELECEHQRPHQPPRTRHARSTRTAR